MPGIALHIGGECLGKFGDLPQIFERFRMVRFEDLLGLRLAVGQLAIRGFLGRGREMAGQVGLLRMSR